jgi:uncharacterized protein
LAHEHHPDPELRAYKEPLNQAQREKLRVNLSVGVMRIFKYFSEHRKFNARLAKETRMMRQETPKVGRNSPCLCGSGKKYKKCCASMREH